MRLAVNTLNVKKAVTCKPQLRVERDPRRVSFAARFGGMAGPLVDEKGRPTRLKKALQAWGSEAKRRLVTLQIDTKRIDMAEITELSPTEEKSFQSWIKI